MYRLCVFREAEQLPTVRQTHVSDRHTEWEVDRQAERQYILDHFVLLDYSMGTDHTSHHMTLLYFFVFSHFLLLYV